MAKKSAKVSEVSALKSEYDGARGQYEALRQEAVFILEDCLSQIKVHQIESRVKSFDSISKNIQNGKYNSLDQINDIVGCRIICLFKSDLSNIISVIEGAFDVQAIDNKVDSVDDVFGYMSIHVLCGMKKEFSGPRYDKIGDLTFELQIRTLCMHAWAAISHYLDYKAEWDIPEHLRKSLNALSGLFYVADSQYESLYHSRQESKVSSSEADGGVGGEPINYDTVYSMLREFFPDRHEGSSEAISNFVQELGINGYDDLNAVKSDILKSAAYLKEHDAEIKKKQNVTRAGPFFADVGAARVSLGNSNPDYEISSKLGRKISGSKSA